MFITKKNKEVNILMWIGPKSFKPWQAITIVIILILTFILLVINFIVGADKKGVRKNGR